MVTKTSSSQTFPSPFPQAFKSSVQIRALLLEVEQAVGSAIEKYNIITAKRAELEKRGLIHASPHWRDNKYLYLIYPTQPDGSRKREYVGTNPNRVQAALAGIERARQHEQLTRQLTCLEKRLEQATCILHDLQSHLQAKNTA